MAYYDKFTKKPASHRDDWRDDEDTKRPARDGDRPHFEERRSFSDRPRFDDRKSFSDRPRFDDRRPSSDRPRFDDRRPSSDRPRFDDRRPSSDRPRFDDRRPSSDRPRFDDRPKFEDRPKFSGPRPQRREDMPPRPVSAPVTETEEREDDTLLVGRNPIREALKSGRDIEKLLVAKGELIGSAREIVAVAREKKIVVQEVDRARLDAIAPNHQGLIAIASAYAYKTVDDMLELAKERGEAPFLIILDGVTDPHNLGAIIRTAECVGAHGVILPERRAVGLTPSAVKSSAGAIEYIPVAKEVNLTRLIERLKKENIWIYGASMEGEDYRKVDFSGGAALVIGSEGEGISRLVSENCDKLVSLPMRGKLDSLNASVAAGVLLYAIAAGR